MKKLYVVFGAMLIACGGSGGTGPNEPPPPPPPPELDSDNDGVLDKNDNCPNTPAGSVVDIHGCIVVTPDNDLDNDGVININDQCPNTPPNTPVDTNGCTLPPPPPPRLLTNIGFDYDSIAVILADSTEVIGIKSLDVSTGEVTTYPYRDLEFTVIGQFNDGSSEKVNPSFSVRNRPDISFVNNRMIIPNVPGSVLTVDATIDTLTTTITVRIKNYELQWNSGTIFIPDRNSVLSSSVPHLPDSIYVIVDTITAYSHVDMDSKEIADETYSATLLNESDLLNLYPLDVTMMNPRDSIVSSSEESERIHFMVDIFVVKGENDRHPVIDIDSIFETARIAMCVETTPFIANGTYRLPGGSKICVTVNGKGEIQE